MLKCNTEVTLSEFAADFMASSSVGFDAAINRALQSSGEYMQADRAYVFLVSADGNYLNNTHEWCVAGIQPEIEHLQDIPSSALAWWWSQFNDIGYVLIPRVDDMPPEAQNEYQILQSQNICSVCVYPLYMDKELAGFIGCDAVSEEHHWGAEIIEFLSLTSDLLGRALVHRQLLPKRALAISQLERAADSFTPDLESYFELTDANDRSSLYKSYENAKASLSVLNLESNILLDNTRAKNLQIHERFDATPDAHTFIAESTAQNVTDRVPHRKPLQRLTLQDPLTGLPSRRSVEDTLLGEMDYCDRKGLRLVLVFLDLDNFREVSEQYGAILGDNLLKVFVRRMLRLFNGNAVVARVGIDEFAVLLTRLQPEESYIQQLNQLQAIIRKPLKVNNIDVTLTTNIGITEYPQLTEVTSEQLFYQAQQALFQAKILGKDCLQKYDTDSEQEARVLSDHVERVQKALYAHEFILYYQPKVNMKTGVVFGVEALIRWKKSTGELVLPDDFLPALYNHPFEVELGDWVIRTALAQMRVWKQQGLDIQVSVNVSSLQLLDEFFVDKLSRDLNDYADILPSALQLEVLESSALNDFEAVSRVMQLSQQLGISFALDDFGTGYSPLTHLKILPVSVLKIDKSFVREMLKSSDDLSIISAVVGMAKAFGLQTIAEGVESIEHGSLLLRLGCEQGQGYGIAKPMPADEMRDWVNGWVHDSSWQEEWPVDVNSLPLVYAEVEHRNWVVELEQWLHGKRSEVPVLDHQQCKVGLWIEREKRSRFGLHAKYSYLVNLHRESHRIGQCAASLHSRSNSAASLMLLPEIWRLRDLFVIELKLLIE